MLEALFDNLDFDATRFANDASKEFSYGLFVKGGRHWLGKL
jgi:hypothetical protein